MNRNLNNVLRKRAKTVTRERNRRLDGKIADMGVYSGPHVKVMNYRRLDGTVTWRKPERSKRA